MKFGLFSNSGRLNRPAWENFEEDLQEIIVGDRVGMEEVWISEHLGAPIPNLMPSPELLIAKASGLTERIRLGCGVRLLPLFHPFDVATQAAVNDQLTKGRYNFGFGQGFPNAHNMERIGLDPSERLARALESVDFI